jgi:hypothetical protein
MARKRFIIKMGDKEVTHALLGFRLKQYNEQRW